MDDAETNAVSHPAPEKNDTKDGPDDVGKDGESADQTSPNIDQDCGSFDGEEEPWEYDDNEEVDPFAEELLLGEAFERDPLGESKPIQHTNVLDPNPDLDQITSILEVHQELFPYLSRRNLLRFLAEHNALLCPTTSADPGDSSPGLDPRTESTRNAIIKKIELPSEWDRGTARAIQDMLVRNDIEVPAEVKRLRGNLDGPDGFAVERYRAHSPQIQMPKKWIRYERELFALYPGGRDGWFEEVTKIQYAALAEIESDDTDNNETAANQQQHTQATAEPASPLRKRKASSLEQSAVESHRADRNTKHHISNNPPSLPGHGTSTTQDSKTGATTSQQGSVTTSETQQSHGLTPAQQKAIVEHGWDPSEYEQLLQEDNMWHLALNNNQEIAAAMNDRPLLEQEIYQKYGLTFFQFNTAVQNTWDPFEYSQKLDEMNHRMGNH